MLFFYAFDLYAFVYFFMYLTSILLHILSSFLFPNSAVSKYIRTFTDTLFWTVLCGRRYQQSKEVSQVSSLRLCLQNNVSNPVVSTDSASDQMASWSFMNSLEAVSLDGRVVGTEKDVLILSSFS